MKTIAEIAHESGGKFMAFPNRPPPRESFGTGAEGRRPHPCRMVSPTGKNRGQPLRIWAKRGEHMQATTKLELSDARARADWRDDKC